MTIFLLALPFCYNMIILGDDSRDLLTGVVFCGSELTEIRTSVATTMATLVSVQNKV